MQFKFDESGLLKHGLIMTVSMAIARFFGYLFHIYVARALGPDDYGVFGSLFAFFMILAVPITGTIQTVISRYTSDYKIEENYPQIKDLIIISFKKLSKLGLLGFIIIAIISFPFSMFLKLPSPFLIILIGIAVLLIFIVPIFRGILQGLQNFKWLALNNILETFFKFIFGLLLISLGFGLNGAIFAFSLSYLSVLLISMIPISFVIKGKTKNKNTFPGIYEYGYVVLLITGVMTIFQNIDVILVKHYFSSYETGLYSAASNVGKTILFLGSGISLTIFPKISEESNNKNSFNILKKGMVISFSLSLAFVLTCLVYKEKIISILYGDNYIESAVLLPYFAIAMSFLFFTSIILSFLLATKKYRFFFPLLIMPVIEIIMILVFHNTLMSVLFILNIINAIVFFISLVILIRNNLMLFDNYKKNIN